MILIALSKKHLKAINLFYSFWPWESSQLKENIHEE